MTTRKIFAPDIPEINQGDLFRALKIEDDDSEEAELIKSMSEEALAAAKPKALYAIAEITEITDIYAVVGGRRFDSSLMSRNFKGQKYVYPFICTCGTEIEEWSLKYTDPLEEYIADGIKLYIHRLLSIRFKDHMIKNYAEGSDLAVMNPGSLKDWPIENQPALFDIIGNVYEDTGVVLTESYLMVPSKSTSGIFFKNSGEYHNCTYCPKSLCPNRSAPFEGENGMM